MPHVVSGGGGDRPWAGALHLLLLVAEAALTALIIWRVPYTEIDWRAYMQEVEGFLQGERDYTRLRGDTGPLVYPAGFVYVYSLLYALTDRGRALLTAQAVFAALYVLLVAVVLRVYRASRAAPLLAVVPLVLSKRIHSIFVLRLFNDGVAMLLLYAAVLLFTRRRWTLGCALFSLAVSVKMNILLFAPGLGVLLLREFGWRGTAPRLALCAAVQGVLSLPFTLTHPREYFGRAFEFSRVFFHIWTVNLKFLPEAVFVDPRLHLALLAATLGCVLAFAHKRWSGQRSLPALLLSWGPSPRAQERPTADEIVGALFESNFIGVAFSRSLHYQFYVWYFHTLPYLLWARCTALDAPRVPFPAGLLVRCGLLVAVEVAFNVYPSTPASSLLLTAAHLVLLLLLAASPVAGAARRKPHRPQAGSK